MKNSKRYSWKSFITLEDFQNFIDVGNYRTRSDLEKVAPSFFTTLLNRGFNSSDIHFPVDGRSEIPHKYDSFVSIQDFQKFINENNIISLENFTKEYPSLLQKYRGFGFSTKDLWFKKNSSRKDYSKLNTIDKIQKFIDSDPSIKTPTNFIKKYGGLYNKMKLNNLDIKLLRFPEIGKRNFKDIKTAEDIKGYIMKNGIVYISDLIKNDSWLYSKMKQLGYKPSDFSLLDGRTKEKDNKWSKYKTKEDLQKYIDESGDKNLSSLRNKNGFMSRARRLGISLSEFHFPNKNKSSLEIEVEDFLRSNNINYISQKVFKEASSFRFDFYLPEYDLILEPGGDQHFIPIDIWGGEDEFLKTRERDIKKKEFCDTTGKTILYLFRFSNKMVYDILEKEGFLNSKYYTKVDEYFNDILTIIENKKKQP